MGDQKRGRMSWPLLAASINADLQRRQQPVSQMQTGTGGKGGDHRSRHRLAGQQIASGNTADTGGNSVGSQNVGTGEMRDITRKVDKRHLPVIAVGAVSHHRSKRQMLLVVMATPAMSVLGQCPTIEKVMLQAPALVRCTLSVT